jgi:hypothetical protein
MNEEKETITIQIPEDFSFGNFRVEDFERVLSFFEWSFKYKKQLFSFEKATINSNQTQTLLYLYYTYLDKKEIDVKLLFNSNQTEKWLGILSDNKWEQLLSSKNYFDEYSEFPLTINSSNDREKALEFGKKYTENLNLEYNKTFRYFLNEILYNTLEHGKNEQNIPSLLQFILNDKTNELFFIVADIGIGIRHHLRQTYPNLSTDSQAILHAIKPQISGTFGRPNTGYETKNNAGVGLYFSSKIVQKLKGDMFIVSGSGFVHISPNEIIAKELDNQWKGTFVYVKIKLGLIKELNFQKMLAEITKSIPKTEKVTEENNLYISVRNYFGKYAEDKDLAKKIRDKYILPALAENKTLTIDFEEIISAPHSLLNAMLATPIERLGLAAYKKIKIINASPDIRETLDFIFDDNTSND